MGVMIYWITWDNRVIHPESQTPTWFTQGTPFCFLTLKTNQIIKKQLHNVWESFNHSYNYAGQSFSAAFHHDQFQFFFITLNLQRPLNNLHPSICGNCLAGSASLWQVGPLQLSTPLNRHRVLLSDSRLSIYQNYFICYRHISITTPVPLLRNCHAGTCP